MKRKVLHPNFLQRNFFHSLGPIWAHSENHHAATVFSLRENLHTIFFTLQTLFSQFSHSAHTRPSHGLDSNSTVDYTLDSL